MISGRVRNWAKPSNRSPPPPGAAGCPKRVCSTILSDGYVPEMRTRRKRSCGFMEPAIRRQRVRLADARLGNLLDSMDICQSVLKSFFVRGRGPVRPRNA